MRVAFSVGKNSRMLIDAIRKHHDNIEFYSYNNVKDLVKESKSRHIYFDRIIYTEKVFKSPKDDIDMLNDYIVENSDSTSIVLIVENANSEASVHFGEVFNSPLYTRVLLRKVTTLILCDVVTKDILELREQYFNTPLSEESRNEVKKGKKGFFRSGKSVSGEQQSNSSNIVRGVENIQNSSLNEIRDGNNENSISDDQNGYETNKNYAGSDFEEDSILGFSEDYRSGDGVKNNSGEISNFSQEDDFLGLGGFGRSHSDTGFLDEEDLEEEVDQEEGTKTRQAVAGKGKETTVNTEEDSNIFEDVKGMSKVILVTGERGTGVTTTVVDIAYSLYNTGESVLIVDADYLRNGVLSFIDSRDFYMKGNEDGVDTMNPYVDEEADIASNGYGSQLSKASLTSLVTNREVQGNYDRILIDCPLDCLNTISERIVRNNTVLVLSKGDRGALLSTSMGLTERSYVEIGLEKYIMNNCVVWVSTGSDNLKEEIRYVKETFLFPNGCWLDNI